MLYQQIPALFYSLAPRFDLSESVKITRSQYEQLKGLIKDYCHTHDVPRLKGLIKRVHRRMNQPSGDHLWHAEFDFISGHLVKAMKEVGYCRDEDDQDTIGGILNRQSLLRRQWTGVPARQTDSIPLKQTVKNVVERWLPQKEKKAG